MFKAIFPYSTNPFNSSAALSLLLCSVLLLSFCFLRGRKNEAEGSLRQFRPKQVIQKTKKEEKMVLMYSCSCAAA